MLSLIVVCYNNEKYIENCVKSILRQKVIDMEIICVDDGSCDDSLQILNRLSGCDERIKLVTKQNGGVSSTRNAGLDVAQGQFICFVDGDDELILKGKETGNELAEALCQMTDDVDLVVGRVEVRYEADSFLKKSDDEYYRLPCTGVLEISERNIDSFHVSAWGKIYRKSVIDKYGLRFPDGLIYEDAYWHVCYLAVASRVRFCDINLYCYYRHGTGIMHDTFASLDYKKSIQHVYIAEKIANFFAANFSASRKTEHLICRCFENYIKFAVGNSKKIDMPYVFWESGNALRRCGINVNSSDYLKAVRDGNWLVQMSDISKFKIISYGNEGGISD